MKLIQYLMNSISVTRKVAEQIIKERRVSLNSEITDSYSAKINPEDKICLDNKIIKLQALEIYLFYKPKNVIVSSKHDDERDIIYDLIPKELHHLKYIGRLDANSEGLLLLTNSAEFKSYIENPCNDIEKIYKIRCFGSIPEQDLARLERPITIDGITYQLKDIKLIKQSINSWYQIILTEGKNREIRKVFDYINCPVSRIIRTNVDRYELGDMTAGELIKVNE